MSVARCAFASLLVVATLGISASAASALTVFPTVKLLDSFERSAEEQPPSKGGEGGALEEWRQLGWFTAGGRLEKTDGGYQAGAELADEYGAYWHSDEYESPAVRVKLAKEPGVGGNFGLWACITSPQSVATYSGYRVKFSVTTTERYTVTIFRYDSGKPTELEKKETVPLKEGEYIGLTVSGGKVKAWVGETVVLEASDTTYTKGYVAFFGSGTVQRLKDFEAPVLPPTVTSVAATSGPSAGGAVVTIKGTGFVEPATVTIGAEATEVKVRNAGEITARASAMPAGTDEVIVTDANGSSKEGPQYTYVLSPLALTESASAVTQTSATLNAMVNPDSGEISECTFEYGTTSIYGSSLPCSSLPGSGSSPVGVSASLTGLAANTTYHFRISAVSAGGSSTGSDQTFTTLPSPPKPKPISTPIAITPTPTPAPAPAPTPATPAPAPSSNFALPTDVLVNPKTGATTFQVSLPGPGTLSWIVTFKNGRFGVFSASNKKCPKDKVELGGKCRPSVIVFGRGSKSVASAGVVKFTVKPSASAAKALKNALKQKKELPVTVTLTFQSAHGGSPVSHSGSLTVN